jgi:hypothetical protein
VSPPTTQLFTFADSFGSAAELMRFKAKSPGARTAGVQLGGTVEDESGSTYVAFARVGPLISIPSPGERSGVVHGTFRVSAIGPCSPCLTLDHNQVPKKLEKEENARPPLEA